MLSNYLKFWNTSGPVFNRSLPAGVCFLSHRNEKVRNHLQILAQQAYTVQLITGASGLGKSTLLRWLQQQIPPAPNECFPLSLARDEKEPGWLLKPLAAFIIGKGHADEGPGPRIARSLDQLRQEGRPLLVLIDSGEHLTSPESMSDLDFLHNTAQLAGCPVNIVLAGPESLARAMAASRVLEGRLSLHWQLSPLNQDDAAQYLAWYLQQGGLPKQTFTREASDELFRLSSGRPPVLNNIAENCLIEACYRNNRQITPEIALAAAELTPPLITAGPDSGPQPPQKKPAAQKSTSDTHHQKQAGSGPSQNFTF